MSQIPVESAVRNRIASRPIVAALLASNGNMTGLRTRRASSHCEIRRMICDCNYREGSEAWRSGIGLRFRKEPGSVRRSFSREFDRHFDPLPANFEVCTIGKPFLPFPHRSSHPTPTAVTPSVVIARPLHPTTSHHGQHRPRGKRTVQYLLEPHTTRQRTHKGAAPKSPRAAAHQRAAQYAGASTNRVLLLARRWSKASRGLRMCLDLKTSLYTTHTCKRRLALHRR